MKSEPTLSVVIANYNYARFIADALDSVLRQEPPFCEVIVVDDGSTDNSLEVLSTYGDRIQLIAQENQGQVGACLIGLRRSTADYVYFLDADDYVAPNLTASIMPRLSQQPVKLQFQLEGVNQHRQPLGSVFPTYPNSYDSAHASGQSTDRVLPMPSDFWQRVSS